MIGNVIGSRQNGAEQRAPLWVEGETAVDVVFQLASSGRASRPPSRAGRLERPSFDVLPT